MENEHNPNLGIPPWFKKGIHEMGLIAYTPGSSHPTIILKGDFQSELNTDDGNEKLLIWFKPLVIKRKNYATDPQFKKIHRIPFDFRH